MTNKDTLQESLRRLAQEWPEGDTNLVDVKCTGIERSIPPESTHEDAKKALEYCKLARQFGATEKGFLFLVQAESARKDFDLFDAAIKGEIFTNNSPRGLNDLGNVLLEILKKLGKNAPTKAVLKELQKMANSHDVIQEIDDDAIYWHNKRGVEKATKLTGLGNRLTNIRKKFEF